MDPPHSDPKPSCKLQPVIIAYLVIAGGITAALLLMWISSAIKGSPAYQATFEALRSHPEAIAALGEPIVPAFITTGSAGGSSHANLSIPVKGPKGRGRVYVQAIQEEGSAEWTYFQWDLVLPGREDRIPLGPTVSYLEWSEKRFPSKPASPEPAPSGNTP